MYKISDEDDVSECFVVCKTRIMLFFTGVSCHIINSFNMWFLVIIRKIMKIPYTRQRLGISQIVSRYQTRRDRGGCKDNQGGCEESGGKAATRTFAGHQEALCHHCHQLTYGVNRC